MEIYLTIISLFFLGFGIGFIAVMTGVGGAVLFVPVVTLLFPFHIDYVRGASLLVALVAALTSSPSYLRDKCASFELVTPVAIITSIFSIFGAHVGLSTPEDKVRILLGIIIFMVCLVMILTKNSKVSSCVQENCANNKSLSDSIVDWKSSKTIIAMVLFAAVGFIAGMFGMGAGWASVPVLSIVMGIPLKIAVASSMLLIAISNTAAIWVYIYKGAIMPIIAAPSILGVYLGSNIGVRLFSKSKPATIRILVIILLFVAGASSLLKGLGLM